MDKREKMLQEIFGSDELGLLHVKPRPSPARNEDERLVASFEEVNVFYKKHGRAPEASSDIQEHRLYSRLKGIRESAAKMEALEPHDHYGLLDVEEKTITSLDELLDDDSLGILDMDDAGLFDLRHVQKSGERETADFIARRKPCKNFAEYEGLFKSVQADLAAGKRKLIPFSESHFHEKVFYVVDGILVYLAKVNFETEEKTINGKRTRRDGRTKCVFENGTESNMLYRSLAKALHLNGQVVTENEDAVNHSFLEKFNDITDEDKQTGFIYVLRSMAKDSQIQSIENLYKIGYSTTSVEERIRNAENEPTYLMAPVHIITTFQCYNMNPNKLEQILHTFFGTSCLEIQVRDIDGRMHAPREWFIAPLEVIEEAVRMVLSGEIVRCRYDGRRKVIIKR